jgi:hypothetical protein
MQNAPLLEKRLFELSALLAGEAARHLQALDGDAFAQTSMICPVHDAEAALPNHPVDAVLAVELVADPPEWIQVLVQVRASGPHGTRTVDPRGTANAHDARHAGPVPRDARRR